MDCNQAHVIAADGGNTKTILVVATLSGKIVGAGRSGSGDLRAGDQMQPALAALQEACQQALRQARLPDMSSIGAGAFCMAGADWPEDAAALRSALQKHGYPGSLIVCNDGIASVIAGCPQGFGVSITAGTYAATAARSRDGRHLWHSGFWQIGGGATALGYEALQQVYRSHMGLVDGSFLTERVLEHFGCASGADLLHAFTRRDAPPPGRCDQIARIVLDCATAGDAAALAIVREEAAKLCTTAIYAARQAGLDRSPEPFPLALLGGVSRHSSNLLSDRIGSAFRRCFPQSYVVQPRVQPIAGAVVLALAQSGVRIDDTVYATIESSLPALEFFNT